MGHPDVNRELGGNSVSVIQTEMGLTAREQFERFKLEAMSELVLRLVGGLLVAGSTMLWLILPMEEARDQVISHSLLAALTTATGLIVYAYGTRGFRRQVALDAKRRTLALTKININGQSRFARTIDIDKIDSLFLRRPKGRPGFASLCVRVAGRDTPITALTGDTSELELLHKTLCELVQAEDNPMDQRPRRVLRDQRKLARVRI